MDEIETFNDRLNKWREAKKAHIYAKEMASRARNDEARARSHEINTLRALAEAGKALGIAIDELL